MFKNPVFYAAIIIPWHVALPDFLIISSVSRIVIVMSLVLPAAPSLLILDSVEAIVVAQCDQ